MGTSVLRGPRNGLLAAALMLLGCAAGVRAEVAYKDTLEKAVIPPEIDDTELNHVLITVQDQETYDSNLYRLAPSVVDLTFINPTASRSDWLNTGTLGLDGQWSLGRQIVTLEVRGDYNRYSNNDDLNNFSSNDILSWNWALGNKLSGQVGVDYLRTLAGFYNTNLYTKDIVSREEYWGSLRYQVGPHLAFYGGVLYADTSLSADSAKGNSSKRKTINAGTDIALSATTNLGFDYRYIDARYDHSVALNGESFGPDYRDHAIRVSLRKVLSEKTLIEVVGGYLKREYPSTTIGAFSGYIWRLNFDWHPTDKLEVLVSGSRDLQAYLSAQTDYFVSNAISVTPTWAPLEKLKLSFTVLRDQQSYIGNSEFIQVAADRRDKVTAASGQVDYFPILITDRRKLDLGLSYRYEHRTSNQELLSYDDRIIRMSANYLF